MVWITDEAERKDIPQAFKKAREGRKGLAVGAGSSRFPDLPGSGDDSAICTGGEKMKRNNLIHRINQSLKRKESSIQPSGEELALHSPMFYFAWCCCLVPGRSLGKNYSPMT